MCMVSTSVYPFQSPLPKTDAFFSSFGEVPANFLQTLFHFSPKRRSSSAQHSRRVASIFRQTYADQMRSNNGK